MSSSSGIKRGARFIHARHLKSDATRPYDSDDDYEVYVITRVTETTVYYGSDPSHGQFKCSHEYLPMIVRKWLG